MGLIRKDHITLNGEPVAFFSPVSPETLAHPYHRIKWVSLAELRSEFLAGLLALPDAVNVLREVSKGQ